jgi:hypothetical protein
MKKVFTIMVVFLSLHAFSQIPKVFNTCLSTDENSMNILSEYFISEGYNLNSELGDEILLIKDEFKISIRKTIETQEKTFIVILIDDNDLIKKFFNMRLKCLRTNSSLDTNGDYFALNNGNEIIINRNPLFNRIKN